jgi:hypothetical protein
MGFPPSSWFFPAIFLTSRLKTVQLLRTLEPAAYAHRLAGHDWDCAELASKGRGAVTRCSGSPCAVEAGGSRHSDVLRPIPRNVGAKVWCERAASAE